MKVSPIKIEIIGAFLAIQWDNNQESIIEAKKLREHSPSAENKGESDLFGNLSKVKKRISPEDLQILKFERVGNYAVRIIFNDGHSTGIYDWNLLQDLGN